VSASARRASSEIPPSGLQWLDCAAILGLGLMGGCVARELAARGVRVLGYDRDPSSTGAAVEEGVLHATLGDTLAGVAEASLVVFAVPVDAVHGLIGRVTPHLRDDCLVTDVGSTKRNVGTTMEHAGLGARFVGSHPLAGDHRGGWAASRLGMFRDARVFLCPAPAATDRSVERVRALWAELGAIPETIDAEEHDRRLAWTSHLPQVIASALASTLRSGGHSRSELGPGGRDATRLAGSRSEIWTAIALENAANLAEAISAFQSRLGAIRAAVELGDGATLDRIIADAGGWFHAVPSIPADVTPPERPS
jgi:prephenate dehydrogenase